MSSNGGGGDLALSVRGLVKDYKVRTSAAADDLGDALISRLRHPRRRTASGIFRALNGVDLDVAVGEVLGVVGHNGAGKSTLLKILSRVTEPSSGRIEVRGQVGALLEVGTGFHPDLTGRENIYLNGCILGMTRTEITQRFDDIVDFSGVEAFLEVPVKRYSSGMSVRLAFAVASSLTPDVLIVDEVLAVGDAEFQRKCLGRMRDVAETGRTVLFVSHNLAAVQALCTRAVLMQKGRLIADGTPDQIVGDYISAIEASGDNLAPGVVDISLDPQGVVRPHLRMLEMRGADGEVSDLAVVGGRWIVDVIVEGIGALALPHIGLSLWTETGTVVASVHTQMAPAKVMGPLGERRTFRLTVDPVPVLPGRYWISVGVRNGGDGHYLDLAERVVALTVMPADLYGSGVLPESGEGLVYLPATWSVS